MQPIVRPFLIKPFRFWWLLGSFAAPALFFGGSNFATMASNNMFLKKPSHNRDWSPDQAILPHVDFVNDQMIRIHNVRHINYRTRDDYDLGYYNETYDLAAIDSVWFLLSPFMPFGIAHTLLSFHFSDGKKIALSVEIRKKTGEQFSLWRMVPQQYELMYIWADEKDVVYLRSHIRKEKSFFYPLTLTTQQARDTFVSAVKRTNEMYAKPEFYHPFSNNCTNNLICHMRNAGVQLPRFNWRYILPGSLDKFFMRAGLIAGSDIASVRAKHFITV